MFLDGKTVNPASEIRYTNMHKDRSLKLKMSREYGTKLESVRRDMLEEGFWGHSLHFSPLPL